VGEIVVEFTIKLPFKLTLFEKIFVFVQVFVKLNNALVSIDDI
jgi:hypothetical protein